MFSKRSTSIYRTPNKAASGGAEVTEGMAAGTGYQILSTEDEAVGKGIVGIYEPFAATGDVGGASYFRDDGVKGAKLDRFGNFTTECGAEDALDGKWFVLT